MNQLSISERKENAQSDASIVSNESIDNPFMTLVEAAASLLDNKGVNEGCEDPEGEKDIDLKGQVLTTQDNKHILKVGDFSKKATFAEELMEILDGDSNNDVLAWMPDGLAFTVVNHRKFTLDKMPKLFKIRNMSSFVRKLTRWGFQRAHDFGTKNSDVFKHPHFQRGKRNLLKGVKCVGVPTSTLPCARAVPIPLPHAVSEPVTTRKDFAPLSPSTRTRTPATQTQAKTKERRPVVVPVTPTTPKTPLLYEYRMPPANHERMRRVFMDHKVMRQVAADPRLLQVAEDPRLSQSLRSRLMNMGSLAAVYPDDSSFLLRPSTNVVHSRDFSSHQPLPNLPHSPFLYQSNLLSSLPPRFYRTGGSPGYHNHTGNDAYR